MYAESWASIMSSPAMYNSFVITHYFYLKCVMEDCSVEVKAGLMLTLSLLAFHLYWNVDPLTVGGDMVQDILSSGKFSNQGFNQAQSSDHGSDAFGW